ncbi:MAG: sigma 54-interacting transcriptional regulator [Terriglobales bacterium]
MQFDEGMAKSERGKQFLEPAPAPTDEQNWYAFFDAPNVGFVICDEDLRYVRINDALARMNGLPAAAHLGKTVYDILGDAAAKVEPALHYVFRTGHPLSNFEVEAKIPARAESARWLESYFPIKDPEGRVRQVGAVVVELPRTQRLEEDAQAKFPTPTQRLEALVDFGTLLGSKLGDQELFVAISDFLQRMVQVDSAGIALYDESIGQLRVYSLDTEAGVRAMTSQAAVPVTEEACGPAFLHAEVQIYNRDRLNASQSPYLLQLVEAGIQSVCCLPLVGPKGTLGSLNLGWKEDNRLLPDELAFLRHLVSRIAGALDRLGAYREISRLSGRLRGEKLSLDSEIHSTQNFAELIGESPALKHVLAQVETVAPSDATVLILGETGTGKELIARAIHRLSSRREGSFVKLNCAAIPTGLLESELFGHEKGAFTGAIRQKVGRVELADGGTLFLDEVGDIPLELQPKLLRVLEDQEFERLGGTRTIKVSVRLLAATNRDLAKCVSTREFRSDLYYRLHVFPVRMPALRERDKDITLLVRYFVQKFARSMNKKIENIPAEAMNALANWHWPGNVRELENFIERSVILSEGSTLGAPLAELDLPLNSGAIAPHTNVTLENIEREHILRVLREAGGVIAGVRGAAAQLGMKRTTLQSRMQKLGITREEYEN